MKEFFVIVLVLLVLLGLTAVRYRRQIAAMIQVWRTLKDIKKQADERGGRQIPDEKKGSLELVNCAKCGSWISQGEATRIGAGRYLCTGSCLRSVSPTG